MRVRVHAADSHGERDTRHVMNDVFSRMPLGFIRRVRMQVILRTPINTPLNMRKSLIAFVLLACALPAFASSFGGTTGGASSAGSSASSDSTSGDDKVVLQARDDAASFVASEGRIRGAQLEAALRMLRERHADMRRASDMQLAQAILAR